MDRSARSSAAPPADSYHYHQHNQQVRYLNLEIDLQQDLKSLTAWIIFFAIVTPIVQRLVLWPWARKAIAGTRGCKSAKDSKVASSTSPIQGKKTQASKALGPLGQMVAEERLRNRIQSKNEEFSSSNLLSISQLNDKAVDQLEKKRWKFVVAATKLTSYLFFFAFSIWALQEQGYWFWNPQIQHQPFVQIPWRLKMLYFMETAYYAYTLVSMFFEPKMKDRPQMVFHHLFTMTLLCTSYYWGTVKYGTAIMSLHDFSDPWMEAAKLFNYASITIGANICFTIFALSFIYLRVYIYPAYIISATYNYARPTGYPHYWITFISLVGLWILHCIWSVMIFRVFYENIVKGNTVGDVREDDD